LPLWGNTITTLTIASQGSSTDPNESNNLTGSNVSLFNTGYDNAWSTLTGAVWISFANTVCPNCTDSNPTPPPGATFYDPGAGDYVTFTELFDIPAGMVPIGGLLNVLSDDSVTVFLNNTNSSPKPGYAPYQRSFIETSSPIFNFQLNNGN